jgi:hypothetical protein
MNYNKHVKRILENTKELRLFVLRPCLDPNFGWPKLAFLHCSVTVAFRLYLVKIVQTLTS